jgi:hypothetical protein
MKPFSQIRSTLSIAALAAAGSLAGFAQAEDTSGHGSGVALKESVGGEDSCVMVFARVGERFRYELLPSKDADAVECVVGKCASGKKSALPRGIVFNAEHATLEGVPLRAGFHEFVAVRSVGGIAEEQVVLIDIQGHAIAGGGLDYASYVARGLR